MIFFEPVFAVREQEVQHLVLAIVEAQRVPRRMFALGRVGVEILVYGTVEAPKALVFVFDGVAVHDIHDYGNAALVGIVDEFFKLLGRAETA